MILQKLRSDADKVIADAIAAVLPDTAVKRALAGRVFPGKVVLVAAGKAAWQMAKAAHDQLGERIDRGIVITKYAHVKGPIGDFACWEAGHPVPDESSFRATAEAVEQVSDLQPRDTVLFLLSGGGSALFELPLISGEEVQDITGQLLASGADITEINTIRKRLSKVKGGRFAQLAEPARVFAVVLSDIIGDPLDMIASGPAYPDSSTCQQAMAIAEKYSLKLSTRAQALLQQETPKSLTNTETVVTGSVRELCIAAENACQALGYETTILTDCLACEAKDAGTWLAQVGVENVVSGKKLAFIAGGETVVKLTGNGKGGRNQELALSAAAGIDGMEGVAIFSIGSDGTDGPTDAAGGYVDWQTAEKLRGHNIHIADILANNDAFHALEKTDGLIFTGPTGTNVNDVAVVLINK